MKSFSLMLIAAVTKFVTESHALPSPGMSADMSINMPRQLSPRATYFFTACYNSGCGGGCGESRSDNCIKTTDRHSFSLTGCDATVILYSEEDCGGSSTPVDVSNGQCFGVNTGGNWGSAQPYCK